MRKSKNRHNIFLPLLFLEYTLVGCFRDKPVRAISGGYKRYADPIKTCYLRAKAAGNEYFAIQDRSACFTSSNAGKTYAKYGAITGCVNGKGGAWRNDVYRLKNFKQVPKSKFGCIA